MQKKHILKLFYGVALSVFLSTSPAFAQWPTLDLAEVFNTITSVVSQVQAQISTVQETLSVANIQQAIGDKLGGLSKIKDFTAKAEKAREKIEKANQRAQKVLELKKKYEDAAQRAIAEAQDKYNQAVNAVNDVKNQVEGVKNQVEGAVNDVKNQVEGVKNQIEGVKDQVEGAVNNVKDQVEGVKNQVEGAVNDVKNQVEGAKDKATDLYGGLQSGFKKGDSEETSGVSGGSDDLVGGEYTPIVLGHSEDDFVETPYNPQEDAFVVETETFSGGNQPNVNTSNPTVVTTPAVMDDLWGDDSNVTLSEGPSGTVAEVTAIEDKAIVKNDNGSVLKDVNVTAGAKDAAVKDSAVATDAKDADVAIGAKDAGEAVLKPQPDAAIFEGKTVESLSSDNAEPRTSTDLPLKTNETLKGGVDRGVSIPASGKTLLNEPQKEPLKRRAFEKISYVKDYRATYAAMSKTFRTGTDADANYFFPDTFAVWADIDYSEKINEIEKKLDGAIKNICADLNSEDETTAQKYQDVYKKLMAEALAHAEAYSAAAVKESESGKTEEDLQSMINNASESMRSQLAGTAELSIADFEQNKRQLVMLADMIQVTVWDELLHYCNNAKPEEE